MNFHAEVAKTGIHYIFIIYTHYEYYKLSFVTVNIKKSWLLANIMVNLVTKNGNQKETYRNETKPKPKTSRWSSYWKSYSSIIPLFLNCLCNRLNDCSNACCGCCSLEKGCKLIAMFEVLVSLIGLVGIYFDYWQYIYCMIFGFLIGFILYSGVVTRYKVSLIFYLLLTVIRITACFFIGILILVLSTEDRLRREWIAYGLAIIFVICGEKNLVSLIIIILLFS